MIILCADWEESVWPVENLLMSKFWQSYHGMLLVLSTGLLHNSILLQINTVYKMESS